MGRPMCERINYSSPLFVASFLVFESRKAFHYRNRVAGAKAAPGWTSAAGNVGFPPNVYGFGVSSKFGTFINSSVLSRKRYAPAFKH